jgi:hydroxymethylbilane synthase
VVEGRADLAVHSAKDLPTRLHPDTELVCIPERAAVEDVFVGGSRGSGEERVLALPPDALVGTSSMRRRALLASMRRDLRVVELRGNVDTRLRKVGGDVVGAVLAAAGIERLGIRGLQLGTFDPFVWTPAPGQGALAVQALRVRSDVRELCRRLNDDRAAAEVAAERAFAAAVEGGCSAPLGCLGRSDGGALDLTGFVAAADGSRIVRDHVRRPVRAPEEAGRELAARILSAGGRELVAEFRKLPAPPISAP